MAIIKTSIMKDVKGAVGGMIFYEVNGQLRMRAKPSGYTKPKNSKRQEAQKQRFREAVKFYYELDDAMISAWNQAAQGTTKTGYNLFIGANVRNFTAEGEVAEAAKLVVCGGVLPVPGRVEAELTAEGRVRVRWEEKEEVAEAFLQRLHVAVYDPSLKDETHRDAIYWLEGAEAQRSAGVCEFALPEERGAEVHVYVFFKDVFRGLYSESRYIGTFGKEGV